MKHKSYKISKRDRRKRELEKTHPFNLEVPMARSMTAAERDLEIRRMSDVLNWPQMHLPVKNIEKTDSSGFPKLGIILHTEQYPFDVFECNQFYMKKQVIEPLMNRQKPECPVHHYDSWEAVVADGWVGD